MLTQSETETGEPTRTETPVARSGHSAFGNTDCRPECGKDAPPPALALGTPPEKGGRQQSAAWV